MSAKVPSVKEEHCRAALDDDEELQKFSRDEKTSSRDSFGKEEVSHVQWLMPDICPKHKSWHFFSINDTNSHVKNNGV